MNLFFLSLPLSPPLLKKKQSTGSLLGCAAELREHPSSSPKLSVNRGVNGTGNFHGACMVSHEKCAAVAGSDMSKKPGPGPGAALGLALAVTEQVTSLH